MKTKEEMARDIIYENKPLASVASCFYYHEVEALIVKAFDACEKKMLAEASESFMEYWMPSGLNLTCNEIEMNEHKATYQAAQLSAQREIEELKEAITYAITCDTEQIKKIYELRKDLEWITGKVICVYEALGSLQEMITYEKAKEIRTKHFGIDSNCPL